MLTAILAWLASLLAPLKKHLAVIGVAAAVVSAIFLKGRSSGRAAAEEKQAEAVKRIERKWNEIDSAPSDVGASFERLRKRARESR
ncbi:hypothetical protein [Castellaniella sp.]|uniref:hypothetical protein n=1 Tax=Castellaniella sp. TaxID=1955812 RepID=UPI002AFE2247|nr:hypothetical protein [Castellaniella sp.]